VTEAPNDYFISSTCHGPLPSRFICICYKILSPSWDDFIKCCIFM